MLGAYVVTLLIEVPIYLGLLWLLGWARGSSPGEHLARLVGAAWLVNLTQPVVWLVSHSRPALLGLAEVTAWVVEAVGIWLLVGRDGRGRRTVVDAFLVSAVANLASFLAGSLL